jgi:hypothetical protein
MTSFYDATSLALFAALAMVMFRLVREGHPWGPMQMAECLAIAIGCALSNALGNAGQHVLAGVTLLFLGGFVFHLAMRLGQPNA